MVLTVSRIKKMTAIRIVIELFLWILFSTLIHCTLQNDKGTWGDCMTDPDNWLMGLFWAIAIIIISETIYFINKKLY